MIWPLNGPRYVAPLSLLATTTAAAAPAARTPAPAAIRPPLPPPEDAATAPADVAAPDPAAATPAASNPTGTIAAPAGTWRRTVADASPPAIIFPWQSAPLPTTVATYSEVRRVPIPESTISM